MPNNYLIYLHGVNTRDASFPTLLNNNLLRIDNAFRSPHPPLWWGNIADEIEQAFLEAPFQTYPVWKKFWYQKTRQKMIIPFAGDIALYLDMNFRTLILQLFSSMLTKVTTNPATEDRLHLIAHSLGSIVLFDVLFGDNETGDTDDKKLIQDIRQSIFGLEPHPENGIKLGSIVTMGSPLAIYSLMDVHVNNGKIISRNFPDYLENAWSEAVPLRWLNLFHPGDPLAYPLQVAVTQLLNNKRLSVIDEIAPEANWRYWLLRQIMSYLPFIQIGYGALAHGTFYFSDNLKLATRIAQHIKTSTQEQTN